MQRIIVWLSVSLSLLVWAGMGVAVARTLYVSTNGQDGNLNGCPGTVAAEQRTNAARHIQAVLDSGCLQPGDTVRVLPGQYQDTTNKQGQTTVMYFNLAGTAASPITVQADDPTNRPILNPTSGSYMVWFCNAQYIIMDGFVIDSGNIGYPTYQLWFTDPSTGTYGCDPHHIEVRNSEFRNTYDSADGVSSYNGFAGHNNWVHHNVFHDLGTNAPYAWPNCYGPLGVGRAYAWYGGFDDGLFEYNEVYHTSGEVGQQSGPYGACTPTAANRYCHTGGDRMIWRNNYFHDCCKWAIFASGADDVQVYNNIFARIGYQGLGDAAVIINRFGSYDGYNTQVYSNTIINNTLALGGGLDLGKGRSAVVKNNIIWGNNADTIVGTNGATGYTLSNNICTGGAGGCNQHVDPQVTGGCTQSNTCQATDYTLASGSPAINQGATLGSPWNVDYGGNSRPESGGSAYDQGAWEFGGTITQPPPPTDPIAWWKFDEASGTTAADSTGNGHTLTLSGGANFGPPRVGAHGLVCTAATSGQAITPVLTGLTQYTWMAWFQGVATPVTASTSNVFFNGTTGDQFGFAWDHAVFTGDDRQTAFHRDGGGAYNRLHLPLPPLLQPGEWVHVAATWDGSNWILYKNGVQVDSKAGITTLYAPGGSLSVCSSAGSSPWTGTIDDLKLWGVALSADKVQAEVTKAKKNNRHRVVSE